MSAESDPKTNADHAAKMIGSLACLDEVAGYWAEAKRRGIAAHELDLLARRRQAILRRRGPGAQGR